MRSLPATRVVPAQHVIADYMVGVDNLDQLATLAADCNRLNGTLRPCDQAEWPNFEAVYAAFWEEWGDAIMNDEPHPELAWEGNMCCWAGV